MASGARRRRKRRRRAPAAASASAQTAARPTVRRPSAARDRPPAPWGSFPLNELIILLALCMLVAAFVVGGERRTALLGVALALGSLATLEFAVREHFAGYRSHSLLLAAVPALVAVGLLYYLAPAELAAPLRLAIGGAVFGVAFFLLTAAFRRRTGVAFKVK